jgi:hypothetical protein
VELTKLRVSLGQQNSARWRQIQNINKNVKLTSITDQRQFGRLEKKPSTLYSVRGKGLLLDYAWWLRRKGVKEERAQCGVNMLQLIQERRYRSQSSDSACLRIWTSDWVYRSIFPIKQIIYVRIRQQPPPPGSWIRIHCPDWIRIQSGSATLVLSPDYGLSTRPPPKNKIIRFFNEKNRRSDYADHLVTIFENSIGNKRGQ